MALDAALDELAKLDELKVKIVEFRYFLGATAEETAELLDLSKPPSTGPCDSASPGCIAA